MEGFLTVIGVWVGVSMLFSALLFLAVWIAFREES